LFSAAASQTLGLCAQSLQSCRGIERNLLAKKLFQSIIYSKESIQINTFYPNSARASAGWRLAPYYAEASKGVSVNENARAFSTGEFLEKMNGSPIRVNSNFIIPLIIPNQMD